MMRRAGRCAGRRRREAPEAMRAGALSPAARRMRAAARAARLTVPA
jgi:hypothetical protein